MAKYYVGQRGRGRQAGVVHRAGPILNLAHAFRYRAIRAYLDNGMSVIADDVIWTRGVAGRRSAGLKTRPVWVRVHVSDERCPPGIRTRRSPRSGTGQCARCPHDAERDFGWVPLRPQSTSCGELHEAKPLPAYPRSTGYANASLSRNGPRTLDFPPGKRWGDPVCALGSGRIVGRAGRAEHCARRGGRS